MCSMCSLSVLDILYMECIEHLLVLYNNLAIPSISYNSPSSSNYTSLSPLTLSISYVRRLCMLYNMLFCFLRYRVSVSVINDLLYAFILSTAPSVVSYLIVGIVYLLLSRPSEVFLTWQRVCVCGAGLNDCYFHTEASVSEYACFIDLQNHQIIS